MCLLQALIKQMGEAEWAALSERDRQRRLLKLKLEEKKLRQQGRYDEAAALLGQLLQHETGKKYFLFCYLFKLCCVVDCIQASCCAVGYTRKLLCCRIQETAVVQCCRVQETAVALCCRIH